MREGDDEMLALANQVSAEEVPLHATLEKLAGLGVRTFLLLKVVRMVGGYGLRDAQRFLDNSGLVDDAYGSPIQLEGSDCVRRLLAGETVKITSIPTTTDDEWGESFGRSCPGVQYPEL